MLMSVDDGNGARGAGLRGVVSRRGAAGVVGARRPGVGVAWRGWRLQGRRGVAGVAGACQVGVACRAGGPRARGKGGHL
jgi:hypothetical protein